MSKSAAQPVIDEVWSILKETQGNLKEVSVSQKEASQQIKELRASQKETSQQIKELRVSQKELQSSQKELQSSQKETDKQLKKTDSRFNTQWGKLIESLVEGKLVEILKSRKIEVRQTSQRTEVSYTKKDGQIQRKEFDILAVNGSEVVAVEVKTVLTPDKVNYFLKAMEHFKKYFPDYKLKMVYGAVAYLRSESEAHLFAEKQGLFVIRATGDSANIINQKGFKPKTFS